MWRKHIKHTGATTFNNGSRRCDLGLRRKDNKSLCAHDANGKHLNRSFSSFISSSPDRQSYISPTVIVSDYLSRNQQLFSCPWSQLLMRESEVHPSIRGWRPPITEEGMVDDTPYMDELCLKIHARVMITYHNFMWKLSFYV